MHSRHKCMHSRHIQDPCNPTSSHVPSPVPPEFVRRLDEIAELFLRKDGDDGWFMGSALLFANGHDVPLLGNAHANQFLDNDDDVLLLRDWSTKSFCVAQATDAKYPLALSVTVSSAL
jgi:alkaline phosphatase D